MPAVRSPYRKFGTQEYKFYRHYVNKSQAEAAVKDLKAKNYLARKIRSVYGYYVWYKKKPKAKKVKKQRNAK